MSEVRGSNFLPEERASLVDDSGIRYAGEPIGIFPPSFETTSSEFVSGDSRTKESEETESLKDQVKGFAVAWGEILLEFGRGCRDIAQQSLLTDDSYIVRKLRKPFANVSGRLKFLNEFLPEDRHPAHAWSVIFFVFILAVAAMNVNTKNDSLVPLVKKVRIHPPSASHILLPDGRRMAYHEQGVPADRARFSLIAPHSFLSSRLAGAAMLAPMINPYERGMTKEEMKKMWETWVPRRKLLHFLARRFPKFLSYFYRQSFLSGKHDRIDNQLYLSLGERDKILIEKSIFEEFWHRDVEESIRQGNPKPFIEEAELQVSGWGFSLADLQVQRKCQIRGILSWLRSLWSQAECELTGFLGPIHIWQGMDDRVIPPSVVDYIVRVLPEAIVHKLPNEGHLSYFFFCDKCHRQIFSTLFGVPQGPLDLKVEMEQTPSEGDDIAVAESTTE
ncbi:hypothetical protein I3760_09G178700 [Carya illinoinensis]|nr:hypothetical protein I3760_09G178700 [Carya illinoinensis]KAG2690248.1 hypothetical protein I3760_09G178700 [Carya illinoinensis]